MKKKTTIAIQSRKGHGGYIFPNKATIFVNKGDLGTIRSLFIFLLRTNILVVVDLFDYFIIVGQFLSTSPLLFSIIIS